MASHHAHQSRYQQQQHHSEHVSLPPLRSLNFTFRPLADQDQPAYTTFDVPQDQPNPLPTDNPPPTGTSFNAYGYATPTSTSAYVHRQFQGQPPSQSDHEPHWQQTPSQVPTQVQSFARTTPIVPTTVDPPAPTPASVSAPPRPAGTFTAPHPKPRSTQTPASPYNANYPPYAASPSYAANTTSPSFSPSTAPSYPPNGPSSYHNQHPYPTPTSAYPRPPSPTPTPTQPSQPHPHSSSNYVSPSTSAPAYGFDARSSAPYENQGPPPRGPVPVVQDTRDARVPVQDRPRHPHAQNKLADARMESRHEMYPPANASVPAPSAVDARHSQSYPQHEARQPYSHQGDSSRPGTSYTQGQPIPSQTQSDVARPYPPESRAGPYTQEKYYPPQHPPEPTARAGYTQEPSNRPGYPPEAPARHQQGSRASYPPGQEPHGSNRGGAGIYTPETRSYQDARHGYPPSEAPAAPPSAPIEQRPAYPSNNADQRPPFGDSRSYPVANEPSRGGYTVTEPVPIVPSQRLQHLVTRPNGPSIAYYHGAPNPASNPPPVPNAAPPHSHSQPSPSYMAPQQPAAHLPHASHMPPASRDVQVRPPVQTVHLNQTPNAMPHSQGQPPQHPEAPRPTFVSPAETMHPREARFSVNTVAEEERERERVREREEREREREHEREREQREREREAQGQRERERERKREEERERERQAELRDKEQRERERDREREDVMHEVLKHCTILYQFASRYAQPQSSTPLAQPPPEELAEMTHRAQEVVRLLESLRSPGSVKLANASTVATSPAFGDRPNVHGLAPGGTPMDLDTRAPKRPWEETQSASTPLVHVSQHPLAPAGQTADERSAAEKDMEIIRTKRALTTSLAAAAAAAGGSGSVAGAVGGAVGAGKSKYRKRSRATPPGKCHSCNIRETPEWRRGPDGARTLCNACGLHYAKLVRKRDKALAAEGSSGAVMRIDMDMLRASARAAENEKAARAAGGSTVTSANGTGGGGTGPGNSVATSTTSSSSSGATSGNTSNTSAGGEMDKMSVHTGSFQIVPVNMGIDGEGPGPGQSQAQGQTKRSQGPTPAPAPGQGQGQPMQPPPGGPSSGHPHGSGQAQAQGPPQGQGQGPPQPTHRLPSHPPPSQGAATFGHGPSHAHGRGHGRGPAHAHGHPPSGSHTQTPNQATAQTRPPPPWVGKAYSQEMHQQSFIRTSHSVSSGASPH